jgi:hypothetical protein
MDLKDVVHKMTCAEYNFPTYIQTTYHAQNKAHLLCGFKAYAGTEEQLIRTMQSGDYQAIQDLVYRRVGTRFSCPFRLHYVRKEEGSECWWELVRHESRHMHPLSN